MEDIKQRVRKYVLENFFVDGDLKDDGSLLAHGVLDSTGVLELVFFLEQAFGIAVEDDEMLPENLDSLDAIDAYIRRKRVAPRPGSAG